MWYPYPDPVKKPEAMKPQQCIPYSVGELLAAAHQPPDIYHRELMLWAATEIDMLSHDNAILQQVIVNIIALIKTL